MTRKLERQVVSVKTEKTAVVLVTRTKVHPLYRNASIKASDTWFTIRTIRPRLVNLFLFQKQDHYQLESGGSLIKLLMKEVLKSDSTRDPTEGL